ncbi:penicillin acylase family protein [Alsobacter sp. SYSU M60028]|uniref:Penicillin acylase family protein n=1 Tax=Alsobacter ponti TaxID=2962936 RepID=A0ABT1LHH1_9HYPH|nr:penicillin acylase family protein [Alsobacter ponti]MCP8939678.1 penicillin acylase family protein [Alsobacter ponti]
MNASNAPAVETIAVPGLAAPAEIAVDAWGIAHIRAAGEDDLFFLQGFNAARDRLWQIDLWRKRGLGLLAADFGPGYLAQDRAARLFLYRGDMAAEWACYGPRARAVCEAFVAGINAFVALTEREPARLPPEFVEMGTRPQRWQAEDVVRIRSHGLTRNALSEVLRAVVTARAGAEVDLLRKGIDPPVAAEPADGIDLAAFTPEMLDVFRLATATVTFSRDRLAATLDQAWAWTKVNDLGDVIRDAEFHGSNNWAVHGDLTDTGRPILASDPHRSHAIPSLRYIVHLTAPGLDLIGAGEPSAPGISLGHNGTAAFGITIFGADQEDVMVYETQGDAYRYGDGFEPMRVLTETFEVKGCERQELALKFTRHGPVIHEDSARGLALALRSVWWEPGSAAYMASLASMRATSFAEFRAAMRSWGAPSTNHVYADVKGHIAWTPAGYAPIRPNWTGLLPVPGDGRFEWAGFLDQSEMPELVDPPQGFVATANEMNLPPDWDHDARRIGHEWVDGSRAGRIREALGETRPHDLAESRALQTDAVSLPARRILAAVSGHDLGPARAVFAGWDCRLDADSAPAALFELWWTKHLKPALLETACPDPNTRKLLLPGDVDTLVPLVERPGLLPDRDGLVRRTIAAAYDDAAARLGPDPSAWRWGDLHHGYFEHALSPVRSDRAFDVGPLPKGGSASTPMHAGYRPSDFRVIAGASVRLVMDVGDWDRSVCINAPGQSGDPRSPHYGDLAELWARGDYVPLSYSAQAVQAVTKTLIRVFPG